MGLAEWLGSLFIHKRVTDSQINILTESQPMTNLAPDCGVVLRSARPVAEEEARGALSMLEEEFSHLVARIGGKEKFLFVGDAAVAWKTSGGGIFQELSCGLFGNADRDSKGGLAPEQKEKGNTATGNTHTGALEISHPPPTKSRAFKYPAILVVFKLTTLKEKANELIIREILKDVCSRSKEAAPAVIGIVYCEEEVSEEDERASSHRLSHFLQETFSPESGRGPRVSICLYTKSRPQSILGVRSCVWEALRDTVTGHQRITAGSRNCRDRDTDPQRAFWDLVTQVGGKESFLLVGLLCPSVETADKVKLFQEVARDLFDDKRSPVEGSTCKHSSNGGHTSSQHPGTVNPEGALKPCTPLEKPQAFPFPVIMVVFKHQFVKEKTSKVLIREILKDVRGRCKGALHILGIVYSEEQTPEEDQETSLSRLSHYLKHTFHREAGSSCNHLANVCFYVKSRPESILGVKRCICEVLTHQEAE